MGYLIIAFFYFCYKIIDFIFSLIIVFLQSFVTLIKKIIYHIKLKLSNKQFYILNLSIFLILTLVTTYLYHKFMQAIAYAWIILLIFPLFSFYWLFRLFLDIIRENNIKKEYRKQIEHKTLLSIEHNYENFKNSNALDTTIALYNEIKSDCIFALESDFSNETKTKIKCIYNSAVELHEQIFMEALSKELIEIKKIISKKDMRLCMSIYKKSYLLTNIIEKNTETFHNSNKYNVNSIIDELNKIIDFTKQYEKFFNVEAHNYNYEFDQMGGTEFEKFCANLLIINGFINVSVTRGSGDQGVDIIAQKNSLKYAIQCKRQSHKLSNKPIQEVVAGKNYYKCQGAIVMTNNQFTRGAIELAKANDVWLWDRETILQMIYFADTKWNKLFEELKILDDDYNRRNG